jgi:cytochrome c oxidase subunit 2
MTTVIITLVLVSITIAIWQVVKIYDIASAKNDNSEVASDRDNTVNAYLMMGFLVFIYAITVVCFLMYGDLPLIDNAASEHGSRYR